MPPFHLGGKMPFFFTQTWLDTMVHRVPDGVVVNRKNYILQTCANRRVLDFGCAGPFAETLNAVSFRYTGIDIKQPKFKVGRFIQADIEKLDWWDKVEDEFEVVVCGEIIEHLSNPGIFLDALYSKFSCPVIITTPNVYCSTRYAWMEKGIESCNIEHVAYYSFYTLSNLLSRHGFKVLDFQYCAENDDLSAKYKNAPRLPFYAEGIIFVCQRGE